VSKVKNTARSEESDLEMSQSYQRAEPIQELAQVMERLAQGVADPFEKEALEHRRDQLSRRLQG
jgi:hypothetical protein